MQKFHCESSVPIRTPTTCGKKVCNGKMSAFLRNLLLILFGILVILAHINSVKMDTPKTSMRIIGGLPTNNMNIPYIVSILLHGYHHCGGSIINARTVVTAAHCLMSATPEQFGVHAGTTTLFTSEGVQKLVSAIYFNRAYNQHDNDQDSGLVRLLSPFDFIDKIQPISMANSGYTVPDSSYAMVAGWGYIDTHKTESVVLRSAMVPVVNTDICKELLTPKITDYMLCAGYEFGGVDACTFDSGGPLVFNGTLIGIVSFGVGCALPEKPGVYARVSALRTWFEEILWQNYMETI